MSLMLLDSSGLKIPNYIGDAKTKIKSEVTSR